MSNTPISEDPDPFCHHPTPRKVQIRGTVDFCKARGITRQNEAIFRYFGVPKSTGYRILKGDSDRRIYNDPNRRETRGRNSKITPEDIRRMERILAEGFEKKVFIWSQLGAAAGLKDVFWQTIQRAMGAIDYHKCIVCKKGWVSSEITTKKRGLARDILAKGEAYIKTIRFSDEVHFGLGPQRKLRIIRRPGERYCFDCI